MRGLLAPEREISSWGRRVGKGTPLTPSLSMNRPSPGLAATLSHRMGEGRESKDECSRGCRMANELLILPLHQTQSALGLKVEAKPVSCSHRERSQGRAVMPG